MRLFEFDSKLKTVGFAITVAAAALALVATFVYLGGYVGSIYMSWWVFVLALLSALVAGALVTFKRTAPFAPLAAALFSFAALLVFIRVTYLYLSEVFYAGVSAEAFANIDFAFVFSVVALLISAVLGNVGIYLLSAKSKA